MTKNRQIHNSLKNKDLCQYAMSMRSRVGVKFNSPTITLFIALLLTLNASSVYAYTDSQLADAIGKVENSKSHPYGILTHYKHTSARQACLNTISHARRDWNGKGDFVAFLGSRYCPVGAKNDPTGLNVNWIRNVKFYLKKG